MAQNVLWAKKNRAKYAFVLCLRFPYMCINDIFVLKCMKIVVTPSKMNSMIDSINCFLFYISGAYSTWTQDEDQKDNANYCPGPPFMMAFVTLICFWILFPLMCCCGCFAACCKVAAKMSPPKTTPHEPIE